LPQTQRIKRGLARVQTVIAQLLDLSCKDQEFPRLQNRVERHDLLADQLWAVLQELQEESRVKVGEETSDLLLVLEGIGIQITESRVHIWGWSWQRRKKSESTQVPTAASDEHESPEPAPVITEAHQPSIPVQA
jgi:hypothetical protein